MGYLYKTGSIANDQKLHALLIAQGVQPALDGNQLIKMLIEVLNEDAFHVFLLLSNLFYIHKA